jgi:hypothetical protein
MPRPTTSRLDEFTDLGPIKLHYKKTISAYHSLYIIRNTCSKDTVNVKSPSVILENSVKEEERRHHHESPRSCNCGHCAVRKHSSSSSSSAGATIHDGLWPIGYDCSPLVPILRLSSPFKCFRPAAIFKSLSTIKAFYGVGLSTPRPTPKLENQGISFCLDILPLTCPAW